MNAEKNLYVNNESKEDLENMRSDILSFETFYREKFRPNPNKSINIFNNEISSENTFQKNENASKKNEDELVELNPKKPDSRKYKQPIINEEYFKNLFRTVVTSKLSNSFKPSTFNYKSLSEIIDGHGSYPEKIRKYIWCYLLSLQNNINEFDFYYKKKIYPIFVNMKDYYPINDNKIFLKTQNICSAIAYWSPIIGNVTYLPNIVYPFIRCFPGEELFVFETIIALLTSVYKYLLEYFPEFPVIHINFFENIIKNETNNEINNIFYDVKIPLNELIWRLLKFIFSECFSKKDWLSFLDFIITYNHHPEMILYFTAAFLISNKNELINNKNSQKEILLCIFDTKIKRKMEKIFNIALNLYKKYSKNLPTYVYEPYKPAEKIDKYPDTSNLNFDYFHSFEKLIDRFINSEEKIDVNLQLPKNEDYKTVFERRYNELCHREREIEDCQKCFEENEK